MESSPTERGRIRNQRSDFSCTISTCTCTHASTISDAICRLSRSSRTQMTPRQQRENFIG
eukprot:4789162-Ditylum_brightwellii.AAC.1